MSFLIDTCNHSSEVLDVSSGDYICTLCGLVTDRFFQEPHNSHSKNETISVNDQKHNFISEILSKLNVPLFLTKDVYSKIDERHVKDADICQLIYDTLIERQIPFTLKEIASVSGISTTKIRSSAPTTSIHIIEEKKVLERCCSKLGLSYKDYTVIKSSLDKNVGGFSPSTLIAAHIYKYCKDNRIKLRLKQISEIVGVSTMSVHRYLRRK